MGLIIGYPWASKRGLEGKAKHKPSECNTHLCIYEYLLASADSQSGPRFPNGKAPELLNGNNPESTKKIMEVK